MPYFRERCLMFLFQKRRSKGNSFEFPWIISGEKGEKVGENIPPL
jgi:hypothetical protein